MIAAIAPVASARAQYSVKSVKAEPPQAVNAEIRKQVGDNAVQFLDGKGNLICQLWFAKAIPVVSTTVGAMRDRRDGVLRPGQRRFARSDAGRQRPNSVFGRFPICRTTTHAIAATGRRWTNPSNVTEKYIATPQPSTANAISFQNM